jgi:hypothetical protein
MDSISPSATGKAASALAPRIRCPSVMASQKSKETGATTTKALNGNASNVSHSWRVCGIRRMTGEVVNGQHQPREPAATDIGIVTDLHGWLPAPQCCGWAQLERS